MHRRIDLALLVRLLLAGVVSADDVDRRPRRVAERGDPPRRAEDAHGRQAFLAPRPDARRAPEECVPDGAGAAVALAAGVLRAHEHAQAPARLGQRGLARPADRRRAVGAALELLRLGRWGGADAAGVLAVELLRALVHRVVAAAALQLALEDGRLARLERVLVRRQHGHELLAVAGLEAVDHDDALLALPHAGLDAGPLGADVAHVRRRRHGAAAQSARVHGARRRVERRRRLLLAAGEAAERRRRGACAVDDGVELGVRRRAPAAARREEGVRAERHVAEERAGVEPADLVVGGGVVGIYHLVQI
mmetsp:Transcript_17706/g.59709  ORF Transcript_17706/g.59709 Transcript_17706/m.59709 type:complete len:307 (+) Transcript_17706:1856-2776(+)